MSASAEDDFFQRDIYPPNPKALSDVFDPVHYSHLYASSAASQSSRAFLRSDDAIPTLLAPIGSEKLLEIRIDVVQHFPCLRNEGSYSETRNNEYKDWPGMLLLTDLRLIYLPYRCRSEKSLRQRFAKLDVDGTGYITAQDLMKSGTSLTARKSFSHDDLNEEADLIDGELINASVTKIQNAFEDGHDGTDGAFSLEEFLDFMGVNGADEDNSAVRYGTIMLSIAMLKDIDHSAGGESFGDTPVADDKNLELINVSIPKYEDVTQSFDKFDLAKFYKFDYKFEDYKFEYRVYIIHIEYGKGSEIKWTVHRRYSAFESLHTALAARLPYLQLPDLPPKTPTMNEWPIFSSNGYQAFLHKRQEDLQTFLQHLVRLQEVWDQGCLLQRFLDSSDDFENFERANEYLAKRAQQGGVLVTGRPENDDEKTVPQQPIDGYAAVAAVHLAVATAASMKNSEDVVEVVALDDDEKGGTEESSQLDKEGTYDFSSSSERHKRRQSAIGKRKKARDIRELLNISTSDGRSFLFHIGRSADASLVESRYGCNGVLSNKEWCQRLKKRVKWMCEEDDFKVVLSSTPSLYNSSSSSSFHDHNGEDTDKRERCKGLKGDFSLLAEYCRIGVPDDVWTISDINANYETITSYPRILILPASFVDMSADTLISVVGQRSRGRIPVLTWLHPSTRAPLCRSSQPMSGLGSVLIEDDILLKSIHSATSLHSGNKVLRIVDARPKLNARANSYMGKGYEDVSRLGQDFQIHFLGIENIHRMRQSLEVISEAVTHGGDGSSGSPSFDSLLVQSNWLYHGRQIMQGALFIASCLEGGDPVLVHCSDGWDRTSQLCALSQILLDPFYRTIVGFKALIEKDFCSFGHLFESRSHSHNSDDHSPIFIQFLDVVWHIMEQFPTAFEFNQQYLIIIADAVYSRCFTTFLGNSERERVEIKGSIKNPVVGDVAVVTTIADALNVFNIESDPCDSDSESIDHTSPITKNKEKQTMDDANDGKKSDNREISAHDGNGDANVSKDDRKGSDLENQEHEKVALVQKNVHGTKNKYPERAEKPIASSSSSETSSFAAQSPPAMDKSIAIPPTFSLWDYLDEFFDMSSIKNELYIPDPAENSSGGTERGSVDLLLTRSSESEGRNVNIGGVGRGEQDTFKLSSNTNLFNRGLKPSVDPRVWKFWDSYFLRGSSVNLQRFQNNSRGYNHYAHQYMYKEHDKALRNQIVELKKKVKVNANSLT